MSRSARLLLLVGALLVFTVQVSAQTPPITVTPYRDVLVFAGAGLSHQQVAEFRAGTPLTVIERTRAGTWLHVQRGSLTGWVISGYLNFPPDFRLSAIPASETHVEFDLNASLPPSVLDVYAAPVISPISETVTTLYSIGQQLGIQPNAITKVGDSLSADHLYLEPFARDDYDLGVYDFLAPALEFYGASAGESVAARVGMTSYVVFDPFWADPAQCEPGETPLACEYRRTMPAVSFIMFGSNDVMRMTDEQFGVQLRLIVQETMARGIIPVLSTFSYHPDNELWWQSINFNRRVIALANEYQLPLINLWAAARHLPEYGLDEDRIHLLHSGFEEIKFTGGDEAFYGATLRNLLSLAMLEEIRQAVGAGT